MQQGYSRPIQQPPSGYFPPYPSFVSDQGKSVSQKSELVNQQVPKALESTSDEIPDEQKTRMIVLTNLKDNVTEADLKSYFCGSPPLEDVRLIKPATGKEFAILKFSESFGLEKVLSEDKTGGHVHRFSSELVRHLNNDQNDFVVKQQISRLENPANLAKLLCLKNGLSDYFHKILSRNALSFYANAVRVREIWIGNLPRDTTEESLKMALSIFGVVEAVDLFVKEQVFAFVRFQLSETASACVDSQLMLVPRLGQVKVNYSDFLKRFNIVGNRPGHAENEARLTSIVFLGVVAGAELPRENYIREKFSGFGVVVRMLSRPSTNETHRSFMLIEMETKEQAKKVKRYFSIEDRDGRRKTKLGDRRFEINVLVRPFIVEDIDEYIAPHLRLSKPSSENELLVNQVAKSEKQSPVFLTENDSRLVWTGFLTKNSKGLTGVDAFLIYGNAHELFEEAFFNLNITNKAELSELQGRNFEGAVKFTASNETYADLFAELADYFKEKGVCGVVRHLNRYCFYLLPYFEGLLEGVQKDVAEGDLVGIFIKIEERDEERGGLD